MAGTLTGSVLARGSWHARHGDSVIAPSRHPAVTPARHAATAPSRHPALPPSRLGFTLIEVLVGLVLLAIVSAILFQLVIGSQRISQAQTERGALQANARAGVLIVPNELRELGYSRKKSGGTTTDIRAMGADFIVVRAMRGVGFFCGVQGGPADRLFLRTDPADGRIWRGLRAPQDLDSLLVFVDGADASDPDDDRWAHARLAGAPANTTCPSGGGAAWRLNLASNLAFDTDELRPGAPVYWFEVLRYETYVDAGNGQTWLGLTVNGGSREPILGPLEDVSGLRFRYFNRTGDEVFDMNLRSQVRSIEVGVNGSSARLVRAGGGTGTAFTMDTVRFTTRISLRNSLERP